MQAYVSKFGYRIAASMFLFLCGFMVSRANNVQVRGEINIDQMEITPNGVATVFFTLEWDNSWRDDFNYDAIYFFLKYKCKDGIWRHMYLMDQGHTVSNGFEWKLANSTKVSGKNEGIFIQRSGKANGHATVTVNLKWDMKSNPLEPVSLEDWDNLNWAGTGIEMVFVPRGPFYAGDNHYSGKSLRMNNMPFPAEYDIANDGYFTVSRVPQSDVNPASNAVNHVNDLTNSTTNAWVGNGTTTQWWMIDFLSDPDKNPIPGAEKRTVNYIAISGIPGHIPAKWSFEGSDSYMGGGDLWVPLRAGTETRADWDSSLLQVYPPRKILKVNNPGKYRYYRISIKTMSPTENVPVIKSVAMAEADLENLLDYSVLVDGPTLTLGGEFGMIAPDSDTWSGETGSEYPNGYKGFYVMKYEISQEQYMEFLNKLPYAAQKTRTIGEALDALPANAYVFNQSATDAPSRNGIILADRGEEGAKSVSFACDLNKADGARGMDGDGQTIACNFLSVNDMLAYADWCGLRPLSEMEYEKMSRRPYPQHPEKGEFAWNSSEGLILPAGLAEQGTKAEKVATGNVNGQEQLPGPVRCGIFAGEGSKQPDSGSSFWGVMELSGNLSEMYYSVNTDGRAFRGLSAHGNGELTEEGNADMTSPWPAAAEAIAVRGGSFKSGKTELATSSRTLAYNYFRSPDQRDSTVTFRLGYTAPEINLSSVLTAENGRTTEAGMAFDTICSGMDYHITGNEELQGATFFTYLWYASENGGKTWTLLENENGRDLVVRNLLNTGMAENTLRHYRFKRKVVTPWGDGESNVLDISVVDDSYQIDRLRDTVTIFDETRGIQVWTRDKTEFSWTVMSTGNQITPKREDDRYSYLLPSRAAFIQEDDKNLYGEKVVELNMLIGGVCRHSENIELAFPDAVDTDVIGLVQDTDGARMWSDGTYARSANEYRNPPKPIGVRSRAAAGTTAVYRYTGKTGSGLYWIDPDGAGPIAPFKVYCDMETGNLGWMLAGKFSNNDAQRWSAAKSYWIDETVFGNYTNPSSFDDAKSPVWGSCKVDYMMFQTMRVTEKAFATDTDNEKEVKDNTLQVKLGIDEKPSLSEYFTQVLKNFPNTSSTSCFMTLKVRLINASYSDFPWINQDGFRAGLIAIAKYDAADTQGVISGYASDFWEADQGLGSLEDPSFGSGGSRSDVGYGGQGAANVNNVLLFVR